MEPGANGEGRREAVGEETTFSAAFCQILIFLEQVKFPKNLGEEDKVGHRRYSQLAGN